MLDRRLQGGRDCRRCLVARQLGGQSLASESFGPPPNHPHKTRCLWRDPSWHSQLLEQPARGHQLCSQGSNELPEPTDRYATPFPKPSSTLLRFLCERPLTHPFQPSHRHTFLLFLRQSDSGHLASISKHDSSTLQRTAV